MSTRQEHRIIKGSFIFLVCLEYLLAHLKLRNLILLFYTHFFDWRWYPCYLLPTKWRKCCVCIKNIKKYRADEIHKSINKFKYSSIQVFKYSSIQVFMYSSKSLKIGYYTLTLLITYYTLLTMWDPIESKKKGSNKSKESNLLKYLWPLQPHTHELTLKLSFFYSIFFG